MADFELPIFGIARHLCSVCGEPSEEAICEVCRKQIHMQTPTTKNQLLSVECIGKT